METDPRIRVSKVDRVIQRADPPYTGPPPKACLRCGKTLGFCECQPVWPFIVIGLVIVVVIALFMR